MKKFLFSTFFSVAILCLLAQNKSKLNVVFEPTTYNFGDVAMWENQPALFKVTNKTNSPLVFLPLFNEIDLEVRLPDRPLAPGESFVIEAIYYTAGKGSFERKFNVFMGHAANPVQLKILGNIKALSPNAYQQCPTLKPQANKGKIEVTGKVVNKETKEELAEAYVSIQSMTEKNRTTLVTDKLGIFISKLSSGSYEIFIEKAGFQSYKSTFFVGNTPVFLEYALVPLSKVETEFSERIAVVDKTPIKTEVKEVLEKKSTAKTNEIAESNTTQTPKPVTIEKENAPIPKVAEKEIEKHETVLVKPNQKEVVFNNSTPISVISKEEKPLEITQTSVIVENTKVTPPSSNSIGYNYALQTESKLTNLKGNSSELNNISPFEQETVIQENLTENLPKKEDEEAYYKKVEIIEIIENETIDANIQPNLIDENLVKLDEPKIEKEVFHEDFLAQEKMDSLQNFIAQLLDEKAEVENKLNQFEEQKKSEKLIEKEVFIPKQEDVLPTQETSIELSRTQYAANNVIFLIDISTSMAKDNKMELLKKAMKNLIPSLRDIDRVAIIAYNQRTFTLLESVKGDNKELIINAIDSLEPRGLTYGVNGIQDAYNVLETYYVSNGNNQIILATDGLFSEVNQTMTERQLQKLVKDKATKQGIKLSVVGFGNDPAGDVLMTNLATSGSGKFIKIRNQWDAESVLIEEIKVNSQIK